MENTDLEEQVIKLQSELSVLLKSHKKLLELLDPVLFSFNLEQQSEYRNIIKNNRPSEWIELEALYQEYLK